MIRLGPDMKRREFTMLLGGVAVTWPFAARAQQAALPVIGLLGSDTAAAQSEWTAAFVQRLRELGWDEGRNIVIEYRWGEGRTERFTEIAAEFVQRKVTLILTHTPPTLAAKRALDDPNCVRNGGRSKKLGLTIPDKLLALANMVIE